MVACNTGPCRPAFLCNLLQHLYRTFLYFFISEFNVLQCKEDGTCFRPAVIQMLEFPLTDIIILSKLYDVIQSPFPSQWNGPNEIMSKIALGIQWDKVCHAPSTIPGPWGHFNTYSPFNSCSTWSLVFQSVFSLLKFKFPSFSILRQPQYGLNN